MITAYYRITTEASIVGSKCSTAYFKRFHTEADELEWEEKMNDIHGEMGWELIEVEIR